MAIAKTKSNHITEVIQTPVNIETKVVVDKDASILKMVKYLDGSKWTVDYYSQATASGDTLEHLDTNTSRTELYYVKINNSDLTVTTPLETDSLKNIQGEAIVQHEIIPQEGDIFIAEIISGEKALFTVTAVDKKSYNLKPVYYITYTIDTTNSLDRFRLEELEKRVIRQYYYNADSIFTESAQLLLKNDHDFYEYLTTVFDNLQSKYLSTYKNKDSYLTVTINGMEIVDPTINSLVSMIFNKRLIDFNLLEDIETATAIIDGTIDKKTYIQSRWTGLKHKERLPRNLRYFISTEDGKPFTLPNSTYTPHFSYSDNTYLFKSDEFTSLYRLAVDNKATDRNTLQKMILNLPNEYEVGYWYIPVLLFIIKTELNRTYSRL